MGVVNSSLGCCLKEQTWVADLVGLVKGRETSFDLVLFFCLSLQLVH